MGNIWQLLERGFMGGVVFAAACAGFVGFFYLLYKLIQLMRPKEVRLAEKRILSHRLYEVSGRGRIAYLILCLEEALRFYGQDIRAWEGILRQLWSVTDCPNDDLFNLWVDSFDELLPSTVLKNDTVETIPTARSKAHALYTQAGTAMIVINAVMVKAYTIVCEWSPSTDANDPDAICRIAQVEETMQYFGVPLPSNEIIQPLLAQRDCFWGKPFDGLRFSYIYKTGETKNGRYL